MLTIGKLIRTRREGLHVNQEELCHGICSVSNLSRIENGTQIPSRATFEALMQRLGLSPDIFPSFINNKELEMYRLMHEINKKYLSGHYKEAEILLNKMAGHKLELIYKQHVLYIRALLLRESGEAPEEALKMLKNAVDMSVKDFTPGKVLWRVLSKVDIDMLNNLAISFYEVGRQDYAIDILYALKSYIEIKVSDHGNIAFSYARILYNLSKWVGIRGDHEEALKISNTGIAICLEYGALKSLGRLLLNKGCALTMLGMKDEALPHIQESYYISRAENKHQRMEIIKNFADKNGITL